MYDNEKTIAHMLAGYLATISEMQEYVESAQFSARCFTQYADIAENIASVAEDIVTYCDIILDENGFYREGCTYVHKSVNGYTPKSGFNTHNKCKANAHDWWENGE